MSVVLQFCDMRRQLPVERERHREPRPGGTAEIVIFPGIRIDRQTSQSNATPNDQGAPGKTAADPRSVGGADD